MKIYLAARYSRKQEMRSVAKELRSLGIQITSRWIEEEYSPNVELGDVSPTVNKTVAEYDLWDIQNADVMLFFSESPVVGIPRGGRHFECGYAYAVGKRIVVIGGHENSFHFLDGIVHYLSLQEFIDAEVENAAVAD